MIMCVDLFGELIHFWPKLVVTKWQNMDPTNFLLLISPNYIFAKL